MNPPRNRPPSGSTPAPHEPNHDAHLRAALRHAPDHDLKAPEALGARLRQAAREAMRPAPATPAPPWWQRAWHALAAPRPVWAGAVGALLVASLTLRLWWGEDPPVAVAPAAPETAATSAPGTPVAAGTAPAPTVTMPLPTAPPMVAAAEPTPTPVPAPSTSTATAPAEVADNAADQARERPRVQGEAARPKAVAPDAPRPAMPGPADRAARPAATTATATATATAAAAAAAAAAATTTAASVANGSTDAGGSPTASTTTAGTTAWPAAPHAPGAGPTSDRPPPAPERAPATSAEVATVPAAAAPAPAPLHEATPPGAQTPARALSRQATTLDAAGALSSGATAATAAAARATAVDPSATSAPGTADIRSAGAPAALAKRAAPMPPQTDDAASAPTAAAPLHDLARRAARELDTGRWTWQPATGGPTRPMDAAALAWLARIDQATQARWRSAASSAPLDLQASHERAAAPAPAAPTMRWWRDGQPQATLHQAGDALVCTDIDGRVWQAQLPPGTAASLLQP